MVVVADG